MLDKLIVPLIFGGFAWYVLGTVAAVLKTLR